MIDLSQTRRILNDAWEVLEDLDGLDLEDPQSITAHRQSAEARAAREERAQASRDLLMLADRLAAAEATVRDRYWKFKGEDSIFEAVPEARVL